MQEPSSQASQSLSEEPFKGYKVDVRGDVSDDQLQDDTPMDPFHVAMMLLCDAHQLSRSQYQGIVEVLKLSTPQSIETLPATLDTLNRRIRKWLPINTIRAQEVNVDTGVLPPKSRLLKYGYYFDIREYAQAWLSNETLRSQMHFGFAEMDDETSEFWHGNMWAESVRTTSGQFAKIPTGYLLPSDCVEFSYS